LGASRTVESSRNACRKQKRCEVWRDDFDMDLPNSIIGFHRIVGPLADIKLYSRGSYNIDGFLIDLSYWTTDKGAAAYFGMLKAGDSLGENLKRPQPEDYITE